MKKDIVPDLVLDPSSGKRYLKGRFLGKVIVIIFNNTEMSVMKIRTAYSFKFSYYILNVVIFSFIDLCMFQHVSQLFLFTHSRHNLPFQVNVRCSE